MGLSTLFPVLGKSILVLKGFCVLARVTVLSKALALVLWMLQARRSPMAKLIGNVPGLLLLLVLVADWLVLLLTPLFRQLNDITKALES